MADINLTAVHAIYRKPGKKMERIEPGKPFTCSEAENEEEGYVKKGAAVLAEKAEAKPAKKPATKPKETAAEKKKRLAAEKKAAEEKAAEEKAAEDNDGDGDGEDDEGGEGGTSDEDDILG